MEIASLIASFAVGLVTALVATPCVARLARATGIVDRPNERKVNVRPNMPLLGGLAVALGFFVALAIGALLADTALPLRGHMEGLLFGSVLLLLLGVWDDRVGLAAAPKFAVQVAAALIAIAYGFRLEYLTNPVSGDTFYFPTWLVWLVTALWIVGVTNAMNLIDGLDGLAAGVGAIIAATLTVVCWQAGHVLGVVIGVALVGSLLGFLPFNFWPARIFLGDTGALYLGYSLALLSLESYRQATVLTFLVPLLALAVPILDTGLSILRRLRGHAGVFHADKQHMHHRLLEVEGSQRGAVLSLYFLTSCFCVIAMSFTKLEGWVALVFLFAVVLLTIRLLRNLGFVTAGRTAAPGGRAPRVNKEA